MDDGESISPISRKRTESNGGSDSELSEGWNIIDQADVTNHDVPSSDGESVEVIDAEDEPLENVTGTEVEVESESRLAPVLDTPAVPLPEPEVLAVLEESPREEMFDSSFRWFLIYAAAAVLVSNIAFLVAENLPTTPKLLNGNNLIHNIPWAEKEEATVEILEDGVVTRNLQRKNYKRAQNHDVSNRKLHQQPGEKVDKNKKDRFIKQSIEMYKQNDKFDKYRVEETKRFSSQDFYDHEMGRYFKTLSEVTPSFETKGKLNQIALILDALQIGLNDLEDVVTENSELQSVLKKQKHKLSQVLTEMEYGISKSLDRVSSNILNKVRKLERRFEHQWCELERRGHKDELKGLFYDCRESEEIAQTEHETNSEATKHPNDATTKDSFKTDKKWNSYEYQVDKDSPGKEHINTHGNEINEANDFNTVVNDFTSLQNELEFLKEKINTHQHNNPGEFLPTEEGNKSMNNNNDKREILGDENYERKFIDTKEKQYYSKGNYDKRKDEDVKRKNVDSKETHYDEDKAKFNDDKKENYDGQKIHHEDKGKHYDNKGKYYGDKGKHNDEKVKHYNNKGKHDDEGKHFDHKRRYYNDKKKHSDDRGNESGKFSDSKRKHDDRRTFSEDKRKPTTRFETFKSKEWYPNSDQTNYRGQAKSEKSVPNSEPELIRKYLKESCEKGKNKVKNLYEKLKSFIDSKLRVPKKVFDSLFSKYCQVNDDTFKWDKRFNRENPKGDFNGKSNNNNFKDEHVLGDNENKKVRIIDISEVTPEEETADPTSDNIIIPNNLARQWVFSHEEPLHDNKSNLTGDWFFRAGESRSKQRWSHHRGDWWFERASHRRNHPRAEWFSGRRKNWFFRRAWARQSCRDSPHDDWCDFSEEETVTVPNPGTNFR